MIIKLHEDDEIMRPDQVRESEKDDTMSDSAPELTSEDDC